MGPDGSHYIADSGHYSIRKVDRDGLITTVAGYDWFHDEPMGTTPATQFQFAINPCGLAVDGEGNLFVGICSSIVGGAVYRFPPDGSAPSGYAIGTSSSDDFNNAHRLTLGPDRT